MALIEQPGASWPGHEDHAVTVWRNEGQQLFVFNCETCKETKKVTDEELYRAERPVPAPPCPECHAGKCGNCDGTSWNMERDEPAPCPCDHTRRTA